MTTIGGTLAAFGTIERVMKDGVQERLIDKVTWIEFRNEGMDNQTAGCM